MAKVLLKIETETLPPLYAAREVKSLKDLARLLKDAQATIAKAVRVFPDAATAKFSRVSVK